MAASAYIICATPRSGSTLLCDLLSGTGVAGHPRSFYRRQSLPDYLRAFGLAPGAGVDFERSYLEAVIAAGTGESGIFGLRMMWPSMPELQTQLGRIFPDVADDAGRLAAAFGTPVYIHLQRQDRVAQAVSRLKAEQSGLWHRHADGSERERRKPVEAPRYDAAAIAGYLAEVEAHEAAWSGWFAAQRIAPIEISCEDLAAKPAATLRQILIALGRDGSLAGDAKPRTARLADAQSADWADRYRRESR